MTKWDSRGLFTDEAGLYDSTVEWVVPYYRKMHELLVRLAVQSISSMDKAQCRPMMALDIGSGTGADSMPLLEAISSLHLVGVDFSEDMNSIFAQRAARLNMLADRFRLIQADILDPSMQVEIPSQAFKAFGAEKFQIIMSAFTLHHFSREDKATVFRLVHNLLEPGGIFLMGDLFNYDGESSWLTKVIFEWETQWFASNFDQSITKVEESDYAQSRDAIKRLKGKWLRHYEEEHAMESVTSQLNILRDVGFQEAGNPFRYWQVGLICAKKGDMT